mmetsp:Transcript_88204/g.254379  ORF Transcript_88204/g.254379 Transcript_88204/m.254379 type:complete len:331 (+) Transcript_88204:229-1221(+)
MGAALRQHVVGHPYLTQGPAQPGHVLVLHQLDQWLRDEHAWHRQHAHGHQDPRQARAEHRIAVLAPHGHGNHGVDDAGRVVHGGDPLVQDHVIHEAKEAQHEHHHRHAFAKQVRGALLVDRIGEPQAKADNHLRNAQNNRELHLHGIHVHQLVLRTVPSGVHTEWIRSGTALISGVEPRRGLVRHDMAWLVLSGRRLPPGREEGEANGEEVVVQETDIDRKQPHHEEDVPRGVELRDAEFELVRLPDGIDADHQQHGAVTDVAIHDPEQKRECHDSEQGGVGLAVARQSISVNQILEHARELVAADVSRRAFPRGTPVRHEHRAAVAMLR